MTTSQLLGETTKILGIIRNNNINNLDLNKKILNLFKGSNDMVMIMISHGIYHKSYDSVLYLIDYYNITSSDINFDKIDEFTISMNDQIELKKLFRRHKILKIKNRICYQ